MQIAILSQQCLCVCLSVCHTAVPSTSCNLKRILLRPATTGRPVTPVFSELNAVTRIRLGRPWRWRSIQCGEGVYEFKISADKSRCRLISKYMHARATDVIGNFLCRTTWTSVIFGDLLRVISVTATFRDTETNIARFDSDSWAFQFNS